MPSPVKPGILTSVAAAAAVGLLAAGCSSGPIHGHIADSGANKSEPGVTSMHMKSVAINEFGGPTYTGKPDLALTAALLQAGGGAGKFSLVEALNAMLDPRIVQGEVAKLTRQYGQARVHKWVQGINFAVGIALKTAMAQGIELPPPANLQGRRLAMAVIKAGTVDSNTPGNGTFWSGLLFDHLFSHPIHEKIMAESDSRHSRAWDGNYHQITNQAFYDVAQALGMSDVKLATYH